MAILTTGSDPNPRPLPEWIKPDLADTVRIPAGQGQLLTPQLRPTYAEIEAAKTPAGGYDKQQLAKWGVPWPPPKGWKKKLLEGTWTSSDPKKDPSPR